MFAGLGSIATLAMTVWLSAWQPLEPHPKQIVIQTSLGPIILEVYPKAAPLHVAAFIEYVEKGVFEGTAFYRAIPRGIVQGGDPITRDPEARSRYGTGGLNQIAWEESPLRHLRGTLSSVLIPGQRDSAGSQFFICVSEQPQLDGQFTAFGQVVEGIETVEKISLLPLDENQLIQERVEILSVYLRDPPPPEVIPFVDTPVERLADYRAIVKTPQGEFEIAFFPEEAPQTVRQFLRFAALGLYDGTRVHRVVAGFVLQGGHLSDRDPPVPEKYREWLRNLPAEFSQRPHQLGSVSMARGEDLGSGMDSFFVSLGRHEYLDGKYTLFGHVVRGLEVIEALGRTEVDDETPRAPIPLRIEVVTKDRP